MNPFGTRGAADFASALDGSTAAALPGLALAARLRTVGAALDDAVAPRPEFRDALRLRLMAVATVQAAAPVAAPVARPATAPVASLASAVSWRRRTGAVAAGALASVVAVSGVAVAGSQSLPGDPFYGVKRTVESFQLRTADGDVEKGTQHLEFAATRLREVRGLTLGRDAVDSDDAVQVPAASDDVADRVRTTLVDMDEQTREGSTLLNEAFRESRATEPLRVLRTFAARQGEDLEQLLPVLPARSQDRARISLALIAEVEETTTELLGIGTCANGCDPSQAAPTLPAAPGAPAPSDAPPPCDCAAPAPAPGPATTAESEAPEPQPTPEPTQEPTAEPTQPAASPEPSPSPTSGGLPVPLPPLPVPVPPLPVPLPTITFAPLAPAQDGVAPALPGLIGKSTSSPSDGVPVPAPAPAPAPVPLPQVAPLPARR